MKSTNVTTPTTENGQPLAVAEQLDSGTKSWEDVQKDKHTWNYCPSHPSISSARTTFYAREAADPAKYEWFWSLQHGRGHSYEEWGEQRVRTEDIFTYRRACIILSQAEVTGVAREDALRRVMQEDLNGFNRYYEGVWGAALGFGALSQFNTRKAAKKSYIVEVADDVLDVDGEALVEYVWRTYRGESQ